MTAVTPQAVEAAAEAIGQAMIARQSPEAIALAGLEAALPHLGDPATDPAWADRGRELLRGEL